MPKIEVQEAVQKFRSRIESDYYPLERSKNYEEDYSREKERRDTKAVSEFVETAYFEYIKSMK